MPRVIKVSPLQIEWLREARRLGLSYAEMALSMSCCEDTLKRILVRYGLATFTSDKYTLSRSPHHTSPQTEKWSRPCIRCRCSKPRPIRQYICDRCTASNAHYHDYDCSSAGALS